MMDQLQSSPAQTYVGQRFGNYLLYKFLGRGGFAKIYLARHAYLGTWAAVKILSRKPERREGPLTDAAPLSLPSPANNASGLPRRQAARHRFEEIHLSGEGQSSFLREARIAARLIHPHIVRVLDFGVEGNMPFLVMDYAPHGTLQQRRPAGAPLPIPTILAYTWQIAEALQYIHDCGLIHRDIKPENILLGRQNQLWLSDFGIATALQQGLVSNGGGQFGTAAYMAPEQIRGEPCFASDQYALALMVYEWLCGAGPFTGSAREIAQQQLDTRPSSLRTHVPTIPAELDYVVLRALAKDPRKRFGSVHEFALALERACKQTMLVQERPRRQTEKLVNAAKIRRTASLPGKVIREGLDPTSRAQLAPEPRRRKNVFHASPHYRDVAAPIRQRGGQVVVLHSRQTDAPARLMEWLRPDISPAGARRKRWSGAWEEMAFALVMGLVVGLLLCSIVMALLVRLHL